MTNKILSFVATIIVLFSVNAFAQGTDKPDVHVGDRWSWQHTNGLANEKDLTRIEDIIEVSDNEIRTRVRVKGKSESGIATYTREWNPQTLFMLNITPISKNMLFLWR